MTPWDPYRATGGESDTVATGSNGSWSQASSSQLIRKGTLLVVTLVTTCSLTITNSITFADIVGTTYTRLVVKDWSTDPGFSTAQQIRTVVWYGTLAADIPSSTAGAFTLTIPAGDTSDPRWDTWEVTAMPEGAIVSTIASTTAVLNPTTGRPSGWRRSGAVAAISYGADPDPAGARGAASKWHTRLCLAWASGQTGSLMASWTSDGAEMTPYRPNLGVAGFTLGASGQLRFSRRWFGGSTGVNLKEKTVQWERFSRGASGDVPPGSGAAVDIYSTTAGALRPYNGDFSQADASDNLLNWTVPAGDTVKRVLASSGGYPSGWSSLTSGSIGKWTSAGPGSSSVLVGSVNGVGINAQDYLLELTVACDTPGVQVQATFGSPTSAAVSNFTADADSASPVVRSFTLNPIADTSPMQVTVKRTGGPAGPVTIWLKDFTIYGTSHVRPAMGFHYVTVEQRYTNRTRSMVT